MRCTWGDKSHVQSAAPPLLLLAGTSALWMVAVLVGGSVAPLPQLHFCAALALAMARVV